MQSEGKGSRSLARHAPVLPPAPQGDPVCASDFSPHSSLLWQRVICLPGSLGRGGEWREGMWESVSSEEEWGRPFPFGHLVWSGSWKAQMLRRGGPSFASSSSAPTSQKRYPYTLAAWGSAPFSLVSLRIWVTSLRPLPRGQPQELAGESLPRGRPPLLPFTPR